MRSALRVPLTDVKEKGELRWRAEADAAAFPDALSDGVLVGPVAVEGVIRPVDDDAVFEGTARGRWRFECARCLAAVESAWSSAFEATAPIDAGPMDLSEDARQAIALAQPMRTLCRPDCRGLCPVCRKNRNETSCGHGEEGPPPGPRLTPRPRKG